MSVLRNAMILYTYMSYLQPLLNTLHLQLFSFLKVIFLKIKIRDVFFLLFLDTSQAVFAEARNKEGAEGISAPRAKQRVTPNIFCRINA